MSLSSISNNTENYFRSFPEMYGLDDWYLDFFRLFESSKCSKQLLEEVKRLFHQESSIINSKTHLWKSEFLTERVTFFEYLNNKFYMQDSQYLNDCLKYIIRNVNNFGNVIPTFISYIVITNFEDIKLNCKLTDGRLFASCCLGDYKLSDIVLDRTSLGVRFDNLNTKPMLRNNNIASLMFKYLSQEIKRVFPGEMLYTDNIWAYNHGGLRFYERLGGKISQSVTSVGMRRCVFDSECIEAMSEMNIKKPELYPQKNILLANPNYDIRRYLEELTLSQEKLSDKRIKIFPKDKMTPQSILLSKDVIEKMINDVSVECYAATDDPCVMQFIWSDKDKIKTTVKLRRTRFNDFELVSMYKLFDEYKEYLYDIETNKEERKYGIVTISSSDDDFSYVYKK